MPEIYFDNAATSYPKPESVYESIYKFMKEIGASSGRGAYRKALEADRIIYETRRKIGRLFGIKDVSRIIFTANATDSLNLALKGFLTPGSHVVTTGMEHNAVWRPLKRLQHEREIDITPVQCDSEGKLSAPDLANAIKYKTKLVVLLHASNVVGTIMPIAEIGRITKENGIPLLVDTAQTAGVYPIDVEELNIDMLAFTGHKGLLGPQGTGGLYIREGIELEPLKEGGTGGDSILETQPPYLPDRYEAGTLNVPGLVGLGAGVSFILSEGVKTIRQKEIVLTQRLIDKLSEIPEITIYGAKKVTKQVGVVSINVADYPPEDIGYNLDQSYGIMVRTGLHCAPCAHRTIGTIERGTLRVGLGYFNTTEEIDYFVQSIKSIIVKRKEIPYRKGF